MKQITPETAEVLFEIKDLIETGYTTKSLLAIVNKKLNTQRIFTGDKFLLNESNGSRPAGYILTVGEIDVEEGKFLDEEGLWNPIYWGRVLQQGEKTDLYKRNRLIQEQQMKEYFEMFFKIPETPKSTTCNYFTSTQVFEIMAGAASPFTSVIQVGKFLKKQGVFIKNIRGVKQYLLTELRDY